MYLLTKRLPKRSMRFAKLVAVLTGDLPMGAALVGLSLRPHLGPFLIIIIIIIFILLRKLFHKRYGFQKGPQN